MDGNFNTICFTAYDHHVWYEIKYSKLVCLGGLALTGHKSDGDQHRMDRCVVKMLNGDVEEACVELVMRDGPNQDYVFECGRPVCGNVLKVECIRHRGDYPAMIAMRQIAGLYAGMRDGKCPRASQLRTIPNCGTVTLVGIVPTWDKVQVKINNSISNAMFRGLKF